MFLVALITFLSWMNAAALKPLGPTIRIGANLQQMPSYCGLIVANGSQVGFGPLVKLVGAIVVAIGVRP
jgi:hypothetical protein